jgi:hypothetical protein
MGTCQYQLSLMCKVTEYPEFCQKCSLTGHVCFCPENYHQCTRRTYAMEYEIKQKKGSTATVQPPSATP